MRIKITENGPYLVTGGVPLKEQLIIPRGDHYVLEDGRELPQGESYALCRCGKSKNPPFCDGAHEAGSFRGGETASREVYAKRLEDVIEGETMLLLDDGRCAFARFCHTDRGDVWTLAGQDRDPENRAAAIRGAAECPAGRLVAVDREGNVLEEENKPEIVVLQDPQRRVSAGLYVKGPVIVEAADGEEYEPRNRVALCRCGRSRNKPFCDASHVPVRYNDGHAGTPSI